MFEQKRSEERTLTSFIRSLSVAVAWVVSSSNVYLKQETKKEK